MRVFALFFLLSACGGMPSVVPGSANADGTSAQLVSEYIWQSDQAGFNEFSGLDMADGRRFLAVTDIGSIAHGVVERDGAGRIANIRIDGFSPLREGDRPLQGRNADAEAVARGPDGRIYVAFERNHRILRYSDPGGGGVPLPGHPDFNDLRENLGLEALASGPDGTLYAIPEMAPRNWRGADHPVYRYRAGAWDTALRLRRDALYLPVGAAFGPDGRLYLLERNFVPGLGFRTRVRRFSPTETALAAEEVVLETPRGRHENLEGLAVWRDPQGAIVLTMISDDNRDRRTPTTWVEYRLPQ